MKMTQLEKKFVNKIKQAEKNIKIAEKLFEHIDISSVTRVLEIGCGIGVLSSYLAKKYNWEVLGADLDSEQIQEAKRRNPESERLKFLEADVTKLPFKNYEFNMVLSFDVLHHIPKWNNALIEISRVLQPDGYYVFNDLVFSWLKLLRKYMGIYSVNDITNYLSKAGLEIVHEGKICQYILFKRCNLVFQKIRN